MSQQGTISKYYTEVKDMVVRRIRGNKKDVALVLSSGGARGLVHIGAIEELEERGYNIVSIAGTSMGSLVAGMYAAGRLHEFKEWMFGIDRSKILKYTDFSPAPDHIVKGHRIIEELQKIVPDVKIEDLKIPYAAVATDLETGHEVVFNRGSLYNAIRSSISIPGWYEPVSIGDKLLIDGGTTNPLPLNRVHRTKDDLLVAVNVSGYDFEGRSRLQHLAQQEELEHSRTRQILKKLTPERLNTRFNYVTLLQRTSSIMIHQNAQLMLRITPPDILVDIPLKRYDSNDYDKARKLVAIGRRHMGRSLDSYAVDRH